MWPPIPAAGITNRVLNAPVSLADTVLTVLVSYFIVIVDDGKKCEPVALTVVPVGPAGGVYVTVGVVTVNDVVGELTPSDAVIVLEPAVAPAGTKIPKLPGVNAIAFTLLTWNDVVPLVRLVKSDWPITNVALGAKEPLSDVDGYLRILLLPWSTTHRFPKESNETAVGALKLAALGGLGALLDVKFACPITNDALMSVLSGALNSSTLLLPL